jgi:hypothetical protein
MLRASLMIVFTFSTLALAVVPNDISSAIHVARGEVEHPGDSAKFSLDVEASCHKSGNGARQSVIDVVGSLMQWIDPAKEIANIDYTVDLINVWQQKGSLYHEISCPNQYNAQQQIVIILKKKENQPWLDPAILNEAFYDLQNKIGELNHINEKENSTSIKITSIEKNISKETASALRMAAKDEARKQATREFLDGLGSDYHGYWYMHSEDFSQSYYDERSFGSQIGNMPGESLSQIKLSPITLSVNGTFQFHYQTQFHDIE